MQHTSSLERSFHSRCKREGLAFDAPISYINIPVTVRNKRTRKKEIQTVKWPVILPGSFLAGLVNKNLVDLVLNSAEVAFFWQKLLLDLPDHPVKQLNRELCAPVQLHGDEGKGGGRKVLALSWQPELGLKTDSGSSRFLLALIPTRNYVIDRETKANLTIQSVLSQMVDSFNQLADEGLLLPDGSIIRLFVTGVKGDWAFLRDAFVLNRHYNRECICWKCAATKGTHDLPMSYTDVSDDAAWRGTIGQMEPWDSQPCLLRVSGFSWSLMIGIDVLHAWHIGHGRDMLGQVLVELLRRPGCFDGANQETRIENAYLSLKAYAAVHDLQVKLSHFSKENLTWGSQKCAGLRCSGSDCAVIHRWLNDLFLQPGFNCDATLKLLVVTSHICLQTLMGGGHFLSEEELATVNHMGSVYLQCYLQEAAIARSEGDLKWKLRPKLHLIAHLFGDSCSRPSGRNPNWDNCWMDEDFIRRVIRVAKRTHVLSIARRGLQKWLLQIGESLERAWVDRFLMLCFD